VYTTLQAPGEERRGLGIAHVSPRPADPANTRSMIRWLHGPEAGLPTDWIRDLTVGGDRALYAATPAGLLRLVGGIFSPASAPVALSLVTTGPDGTIWAAGEYGGQATVMKSGREVGSVACRQLVALTASDDRALLVCERSVHRIVDTLSTVDLDATELVAPANQPEPGEMRRPAVWLTGAVDDLVYGHTHVVARVARTGVHTVTRGHIRATTSTPSGALLADFDGRIIRVSGDDTQELFVEPGTERLHVGASGAAWIVTADHLIRRAAAAAGAARTSWSLAGPDYLSPGVLDVIELDGQAVLATNEGLWFLNPS
jgi:hypothetical protein